MIGGCGDDVQQGIVDLREGVGVLILAIIARVRKLENKIISRKNW